jgi:hypothetical protein
VTGFGPETDSIEQTNLMDSWSFHWVQMRCTCKRSRESPESCQWLASQACPSNPCVYIDLSGLLPARQARQQVARRSHRSLPAVDMVRRRLKAIAQVKHELHDRTQQDNDSIEDSPKIFFCSFITHSRHCDATSPWECDPSGNQTGLLGNQYSLVSLRILSSREPTIVRPLSAPRSIAR